MLRQLAGELAQSVAVAQNSGDEAYPRAEVGKNV